jgi:hypothetical protein
MWLKDLAAKRDVETPSSWLAPNIVIVRHECEKFNGKVLVSGKAEVVESFVPDNKIPEALAGSSGKSLEMGTPV